MRKGDGMHTGAKLKTQVHSASPDGRPGQSALWELEEGNKAGRKEGFLKFWVTRLVSGGEGRWACQQLCEGISSKFGD